MMRSGTEARDQRRELRLTQLSQSAGTAGNLAASELTQVLRQLVSFADPAVLVDARGGDGAAVYRLDADRALVATVDVLTPIVDDPFDFGRIAAANALSNVYATGGRPLFALSLIAFPRRLLDTGMLEQIVDGAGDSAGEAGIAIIGGHSSDDDVPKYGLCVIGEVHPERIVRSDGARPGDALVLTKPIGTGVLAAALKRGAASDEAVAAAVAAMAALNRGAAAAMLAGTVHAATDVGGFGLLGHLRNMLRASGAGAELHASAVPLLPSAAELAAAAHVPGGTKRNQADSADVVWHDTDAATKTLLSDAQTSGGLLIAVPPDEADALIARLRTAQTPAAAVIGTVTDRPGFLEVGA